MGCCAQYLWEHHKYYYGSLSDPAASKQLGLPLVANTLLEQHQVKNTSLQQRRYLLNCTAHLHNVTESQILICTLITFIELPLLFPNPSSLFGEFPFIRFGHGQNPGSIDRLEFGKRLH